MIAELFRRWVYVRIVQAARSMAGVAPHYKAVYAHDYMQSPRWYAIRSLRLWLDGNRCTFTFPDGGRCHMRMTLQIHHRSYRHKGKSFIGELFDCETRCDAHHSKDS